MGACRWFLLSWFSVFVTGIPLFSSCFFFFWQFPVEFMMLRIRYLLTGVWLEYLRRGHEKTLSQHQRPLSTGNNHPTMGDVVLSFVIDKSSITEKAVFDVHNSVWPILLQPWCPWYHFKDSFDRLGRRCSREPNHIVLSTAFRESSLATWSVIAAMARCFVGTIPVHPSLAFELPKYSFHHTCGINNLGKCRFIWPIEYLSRFRTSFPSSFIENCFNYKTCYSSSTNGQYFPVHSVTNMSIFVRLARWSYQVDTWCRQEHHLWLSTAFESLMDGDVLNGYTCSTDTRLTSHTSAR